MAEFTLRRLSADACILITLQPGYEADLPRIIEQITIYLNQTRQETSLVFDVLALRPGALELLVGSLSIITRTDLAVLDHDLIRGIYFVGSGPVPVSAIDQRTCPTLDLALNLVRNQCPAA